jgi:hypothetical protein
MRGAEGHLRVCLAPASPKAPLIASHPLGTSPRWDEKRETPNRPLIRPSGTFSPPGTVA